MTARVNADLTKFISKLDGTFFLFSKSVLIVLL